jgi:hypothetical protein
VVTECLKYVRIKIYLKAACYKEHEWATFKEVHISMAVPQMQPRISGKISSSGSVSDLYLRGAKFESQPDTDYSAIKRFSWIPSVSLNLAKTVSSRSIPSSSHTITSSLYATSAEVSTARLSKLHINAHTLHGFSPQTNYIDRATAACRRS